MLHGVDAERRLPRLHMLGTLAVVLTLALGLGGYFAYRSLADHEESLARLEARVAEQQRQRLRDEMEMAIGYLRFVQSRTEEVLRQAIREQVDVAYATAAAIHRREAGRRPPAEVRRLIVEALRPVRFFEGRGYLFIDDLDGNCILLPTAPHLEGTSLYDNRDDTGHYIMRGLIEAVRNPEGAGESRYRWYRPDVPGQMAEKLSYVRRFAPYDWVIGTGDYLYQWEQRLQQEALQRLRAQRIGRSGYFTVNDRDGRVLLSPGVPGIDGQPLDAVPDFVRSASERILARAETGGGFLSYEMPGADGQVRRKQVYVATLPEWGWVIGAGVEEDEIRAAVRAERDALAAAEAGRPLRVLGIAALAALLAMLASYAFSRWLAGVFGRYHSALAERNEVLEEQARALELSAKVFESASEGILIADADERIIAVNPAFTAITGYTAAEAVGQTPRLLASGRHSAEFYRALWATLERDGRWRGEVWNRNKAGAVYPEWLSINLVRDPQGRATHYIATFSDISERKAAEEHIRRLAEQDPLTGLPNRLLLRDRLGRAVAAAERRREVFAVLYLDLDRFKTINDSLGHGVGDELLREVARRLTGIVRAVDTVSRVGGDEFVVLLPNEVQPAQAMQVAQKVQDALSTPFHVGGYELSVAASVGIALYPEDGSDAEALLRNADAAMYQAKADGRNQIRFFTAHIRREVQERLEIENGIRRALQAGEFSLAYQPIVEAGSGRPIAAEALLRWTPPGGRPVPPERFIPVAEESGLILPLGAWVLREACRQLRAWDDAGHPGLTMAVNVSVLQLRHGNVAGLVRAALDESGLAPGRLELEVTETTLADGDAVEASLRELAELGVALSLDDFGTGYSSLSYLKHLEFDVLKIDRSFISDIDRDSEDMAIIRAILDIARNLGMQTVAEGVETAGQRAFLEAGGCTWLQGYLISRPLPAEAFSDWLAQTASGSTMENGSG